MLKKITGFVILTWLIGCGSSGSGGGNGGGTSTGGSTAGGTGGGSSGGTGGGNVGGSGNTNMGGTGGENFGGSGGGNIGGGGGSGGGATTGLAACNDLCQKAAAASLCTGSLANCQSGCSQAYQQFPNCASELDAAFICGDTRPLSDFHCGTNGTPQLNAGVCQTEVDALTACVT